MSRDYDSNSRGLALEIKNILQGTIISFFLLLTGSVFVALIISFVNFDKFIVQKILIIFNYISILIGAFFTGNNVKRKGWLNGGLVGFSHMTLIFLISIFCLNTLFNIKFIIILAIGVLTGLIGGMFGINCK
jgi:putative membrane protein (TIGR04086 family)